MAQITNTFIPFGSLCAGINFTAATGTDYFVPDNADARVALIIKNSNAQGAAVTIKAGNGALSPQGDIVINAAAGSETFAPLSRMESARIKVLTGDDRGKVVIDTAVATGGTVSNVTIGVVSEE